MDFNKGWKFQIKGDDSWQSVDLPHDWLIKDTKHLYQSGVGIYKKTLELKTLSKEQSVFLHFDGVYQDSILYVNDEYVGAWKNGYTAFSHEITDFVNPNENKIVLEVHYESPNSRWYSGAGIYRNVALEIKEAAHFIHDGIYITPILKSENEWHIKIDAEIETAGMDCEVRHKVLNLETDILPDGTLKAIAPTLWDVTNPHCYILESELWAHDQCLDVVQNRFGFRTIAFTPNDGFILNGRRLPLNGVCQHHDLGGLGAAVHKNALKRQLTKLKQMGVNAIRTAHNPPAKVFMDLTDEMGFVVMSEILDMWKRPKTKYDYARFFEAWIERDVASWVRRDRNCPSLIMWSVGNEIYDTHANADDGAKTLKYLMNLVEKHDPNKHGAVTFCSNYMPWENTQKCADVIKLMGYNYGPNLYNAHHEKHPDWIIYGGETASTVQSRGIYHFPMRKALLADDDLQCSSLGNSSTSWGAKSTEIGIIDHRDPPFVLGQFLWTGTDYIGEPTPYHTKNSYFGQIDTAGFEKDAFYIYKSAWVDMKDEAFIHLFPYWDFSPGQPIDVCIATNASHVELFLNDVSLGKKDIDHVHGKELMAKYIVPYAPGVLRACAYDGAGNLIAETFRSSFGDVANIKIDTEVYGDLMFATLSATDKNENSVDNANCRVHVHVENGTLLVLDNGDSTDYEQYQGTSTRRLFSGKLLAIVSIDNKTHMPVITATPDDKDIPIRKIEILRDGYDFTAKIYPENATYQNVQWRLANDAGIDSPLGSLTVHGNNAVLTPVGDGEVYVRCAADNGLPHLNIISLLPLTITGYGNPHTNPYNFVSGGLYDLSQGVIGNGNERGAVSARDGESAMGFSNLDFGSYGSDEITLGLFPLSNAPTTFEIWSGLPGTGKKIMDCLYDKGSIWNTYIDATYKLPEKLTGIQTLSFAFSNKFHVKGFQFTKPQKALEKHSFTDNDHIYGDSFTITAHAVEHIGNNVTILYSDMDFETDKPATNIEICWKSTQDVNTIKLVFTHKNGSETQNLLTLPACKDYDTTTLALENPLHGDGNLSFIFLPGSDISLKYFKLLS